MGRELLVGLDVGSTTVKAVVVARDSGEIDRDAGDDAAESAVPVRGQDESNGIGQEILGIIGDSARDPCANRRRGEARGRHQPQEFPLIFGGSHGQEDREAEYVPSRLEEGLGGYQPRTDEADDVPFAETAGGEQNRRAGEQNRQRDPHRNFPIPAGNSSPSSNPIQA